MATCGSISEYARLCTLKNRPKNLDNKHGKYKYMDITGSYPGFKEKKSGEIVLCSCCKDAIKKDIDIINKKIHGVCSDSIDMIWYLGPLFPRDIFKSLDFYTLRQMDSKRYLNVDAILKMIKFDDRICRLCNVEDGEAEKITFEEFSDYKVAYKHQVMNELNIYADYYIGGGHRILNYSVQKYKLALKEGKYDTYYEDKSYLDYLDFHEITKVIPILKEQYNESRYLNSRFWIGKDEIRDKKQYFEDIDLVLKSRLGYGKALGKWKREEELYQLIRSLYKKYNVIYQYRPSFLYNDYTKGQQSIDIYIEGLKIGIEYQGKQHYEAVSIFGGEEGLKKTKERDEEKLRKCENNGIKILYIKYDEKFTKSSIKKKIDEMI